MRKFIFLLTALAAMSFGGQCSAEVKTFHAESEYFMNKSEPILDAQDKVFKDAIRLISEEAGFVMENLSSAKNGRLDNYGCC